MTPQRPGTVQLRGAFVGGMSGATSIATHAASGGHTSIGQGSLALLVLVCAAVGVAGASLRSTRNPLLTLMAILFAGQVIGHSVPAAASAHPMSLPSVSMISAHAAAVLVTALLIRAAERGFSIATSVVRRVTRVLLRAVGVDSDHSTAQPLVYHARVVLRLLASSGIGTRGPPRTFAHLFS
ncbi:hypothetical protein [Rhodococcus marinonascens]|uniref:hypothetical protein n=1 Tax=Rhodococcus marinonascens TaxID=38311 RepID=UPI000932BA28|nr:hypothetical protein [Rhodococcus marinonascens]